MEIATVTEKIRFGTGVTCPLIRIHPAIIAQAAATIGAMMPGRFFLGVGTGENLNEHITGQRWPEYEVRAEMLEEAIQVIRLLWEGGVKSHHGRYYTVENAQIYTLPDPLPEIMLAASGPNAAELAGRVGDGLISTSADKEIVGLFEKNGKGNRPKIGQFTVCCARSESESRRIAYEYWPNAALKGELGQELPTPKHFEQAVQMVTEEQVAQSVICSNKPQEHLDKVQEYIDAGFDHIYVHQVGPDQNTFFDFYKQHILPAFA